MNWIQFRPKKPFEMSCRHYYSKKYVGSKISFKLDGKFSPHFKFRQKMSCFSSLFPSLPCLPSLEVDLMICTVGCDVSKLWSSTAGVSFNSILVFLKDFSCLRLFFSSSCRFFNVYTTQKKSAGGLYFSGSSNEDFDSSACFPSLFSTM